MVDYPPYVNSYGQLPLLFGKIKEASVPTRFTQDFLSSMLELKSSSFRPMIPFLKRLGFLDQSNTPTSVYSQYRDVEISNVVMAQQVKVAYKELYKAHEFAHKLKKEEIISKLSSILGVAKDDGVLPTVAATFLELCKLSNFEDEVPTPSHILEKESSQVSNEEKASAPSMSYNGKLGISYTINLNLPASTDTKVFDAIFKSLKENLLK